MKKVHCHIRKLVIEKNIPISEALHLIGNKYKETIKKMVIGDSIFFESKKSANNFIRWSYRNKTQGKFTQRTLGNGVRVWRIK